ncbi:MAG: SIS domain-containing protein [bacterium]|nr:SIS domain-containing protein [bacterium]
MSKIEEYFSEVKRILHRIEETQTKTMERVANLIAEGIINGSNIFIFGASHSAMMAEELTYRAGGLMLINPIFAPGLSLSERPVNRTSKLERLEGFAKILLDSFPLKKGDILIIASVSGRNTVPVEMALEAKERGLTVIALTSLEYSKNVTSRHKSGKKVYEIADIVLDNCCPKGDAILQIDNLPQKVAPTSTIAGVYILNAIIARVVEILVEKGIEPPIYLSGNLDGGDEYNTRKLQEYKDRIFYM